MLGISRSLFLNPKILGVQLVKKPPVKMLRNINIQYRVKVKNQGRS